MAQIQLYPEGAIPMFEELAPLLRHRAVLFTVTQVEEDQFQVNVIPKRITDDENEALTIPVSVTGTVKDLDRELAQTLPHFVSSHLALKNTLDRAKAEMEEASKAARAEVRKKSGSQTTKKNPAEPSDKPRTTPEASAATKAEPPKAASLFDSAPEPAAAGEADVPLSSAPQPPDAASKTDED
jgi:PRTRC genetic system protein E